MTSKIEHAPPADNGYVTSGGERGQPGGAATRHALAPLVPRKMTGRPRRVTVSPCG
ncbi:MAG TPA: hypothetical protein VF713_06830 [Thermoanaerobaculia bacterium]